MSRNPSHRWQLKIQPDAKQVLDEMSGSNKRTTFRQLKQLLEAEAPFGLSFVDMLKEKRYERVRKFRVGSFRVLFVLENKTVVQGNYEYKGTLHIIDISDRKDAYKN